MFRQRRLMMFFTLIIYCGVALVAMPYVFEGIRFRYFPLEALSTVGAVLMAGGLLFFVANYLGILGGPGGDLFGGSVNYRTSDFYQIANKFERQLDAIATAQREKSIAPAIIDDAAKVAIVGALTEEAKGALSTFIQTEVFKLAAQQDEKERRYQEISTDFNSVITEYKGQMATWRRNANVNLFIGLVCAVGGILLMWQILISIQWSTAGDGALHWGDAYRFIARFGLVILVESVAFFFLKLYREDRGMIRYLRNEITNLESRSLALKTALTFAKSETLSRVLLALASTERNFVLKKGERVLTDLLYENNEVLFEKLLGRKEEAQRRNSEVARKDKLDDHQ